MEFNNRLISPDNIYRQSIFIELTELEIETLYTFLRNLDTLNIDLPDIVKTIRTEFWYTLLETREFNLYLKSQEKP